MTEERMTLRIWPSAVPRINDCAAAAYPMPGITITQPSGAPARIGSAIHALAAQIVRENLSNCPDATGYAVDHDVLGKLKDITIKGIYAAQMWGEIRGEFDLETVQTELYGKLIDETGDGPALRLSGYRDVQGVLNDGVSIGIIDWKSGQPDIEPIMVKVEGGADEDDEYIEWVEKSDSIFQLKSYALHALTEHPDRSLVRLYLGWLAERYYVVVTYTREEIFEWWESFQYRVRNWDGKTYCPGSRPA